MFEASIGFELAINLFLPFPGIKAKQPGSSDQIRFINQESIFKSAGRRMRQEYTLSGSVLKVIVVSAIC
jgi:hypothetical protein